jgi:gliding motility-associated-like protein
MMRKLLPQLIGLLLINLFASAQDFSNKGKDFWVGYGYHVRYNSGSPTNGQDMVLYIATDKITTVTVSIPGLGYTQTYNNIPANTIFTTNPLPKAGAQDARLFAEGVSSKGIHVVASEPVVAYTHIYSGNVSGATLMFPTNTLGREYYSINFTQNSNEANSNCFFYAVATDTGITTVQIIPSASTQTMQAGMTYTYNLTQGQVINVMGTLSGNSGVDLTGSIIRTVSSGSNSCKRIAVFSGSGKIYINCAGNTTQSADNYMVQAFPKNAWGKRYLTTPSFGFANNYYRICVSDPTTIVKVNGNTISGLTGSFYYQINNALANYIEADKPIMVAQYLPTAGTCGSTLAANLGDPEVVYLSPIEQNINKVLLNSTANFAITNHYVNVVIPTAGVSSFRIDGAVAANSFIAHPNLLGYSYLRQPVTAGQHTLQSDSGFNAIAYGYGGAESYGYNAGTNVIDLFQFVSVQNQLATVNFPATCKDAPFKFSITLPYQPTSITWDFANTQALNPNNQIVNNTPTPDSTFIKEGRTLYVYRLPGTYFFNNPGVYPVKVLVTNPTADGCSGSQEINYDVTVYDKPIANFNLTTTGCINELVQFTDASNGFGRPVNRWVWDLMGTASNQQSPQQSFATAGTQTIQLRAITDIGCFADTIKTFELSSKPIANFGISAITCQDSLVRFTDASTIANGNLVKWSWDFGNGNTLVNNTNAIATQTYTSTGSYTASLQVESSTGCKSAITPQTFSVTPFPAPDFNLPGNVCLPIGLANFANQSTIPGGSLASMTFVWNYGNSLTSTTTNGSTNYTGTGPYNVTLTATSANGCVKAITKQVTTIYPRPTASFNNPTEVCLRDSSRFTQTANGNGSIVASYHWSFGTAGISSLANPAFLFTAAGSFPISLYVITDKGCYSDTVTLPQVVNPLPLASFTVSPPACVGKNISFTPTSTPQVGNIVRWYWDFADGNTTNYINGNSFTHSYSNVGAYAVKHMVETDKGCKSDTANPQTVQVNFLPIPNFILPEVCLTDAFAEFTDSSYIDDNTDSMFTYLWNFGDMNATMANPNTSTLKNPKHKYTAVGNYTVTLTVTSVNGCSVTTDKSFTVNGDIPVAGFNFTSAAINCANLPISLQNTSTVNFGAVTKVEIIWDDATPTVIETDNNPTPGKIYTHQYPNFQTPASKTFQVRFRAYSGGSCSDDEVKPVTVQASPKVTFITQPGICLSANPRQITEATELSGLPGSFIYTNLTSSTGVSVSGLVNPVAAGVGTYNIQYLYITNMGCRDSATSNITVWPRPIAKWGISNPLCEKNALQFSDSSAANFSNLVNWNWNFGDATTANYSNNNAFTKTYTNAGNYAATLVVTTDSGCVSLPETKNLTVHYLPRVTYDTPQICLPDGRGVFTGNSTIPDGTAGLFTYLWTFGDAANTSVSTLKDPTHRFSSMGTYLVTLRVTSNQGCTDSLARNFSNILPQPSAGITANPLQVCLGEPIAFSSNSNGSTSAIQSWHWNFADGTTANTTNTSRTYAMPGNYVVRHYIINQQGCTSDTANQTVTVHPYPTVDLGVDLFVLEGGNITIKPMVTGTNLSYAWSPATYLSSDTAANPICTPGADITYTLRLTGIGGCSVTDQVFVKLLLKPLIPNIFTPNGDGIHDTWVIGNLESYPGCTVDVFDRGGNRVLSSTGYQIPWNGKLNGKDLPVGTYYYVINPKNGRSPISGSVTIVR